MFDRRKGPSKAAPNTLCQKCLKRGHYSYECTAAQQERPYSSRPSRSQQLKNPKLAPKLTNDVLNDERPDKVEQTHKSKRDRSPSISSDSVSTISTNRSRSRTPVDREPRNVAQRRTSTSLSRSRSPLVRSRSDRDEQSYRRRSRSRSPYRSTRNVPLERTRDRERSLSPYSKRVALSRNT